MIKKSIISIVICNKSNKFIFSVKFCEIFQGLINKNIPGLFQGFPGLQKFSRVFQDFQGPYEHCNKDILVGCDTVHQMNLTNQISEKLY